jgi:hypothetical protein
MNAARIFVKKTIKLEPASEPGTSLQGRAKLPTAPVRGSLLGYDKQRGTQRRRIICPDP